LTGIDLFRIYSDDNDIEAVKRVLSRGKSWASGPENRHFELLLSKYMGVKNTLLFNSGTSAQYTLLKAHGLDSGEIIVPSFTFISTVNTIELAGARPIFADIEDVTLGLDPDDVNERITKDTRCIIAVHFAGAVCKDIIAIREIADDHGLVLIEDAAESMGATIGGVKAGTIGHSSILSFCQNKIITTGEGGALCTNDPKVAERARLIRSHGRDERSGEDFFTSKRKMDYISPGYNLRMPTINAALGISQLGKIEMLIEMRRERARSLSDRIGKHGNIKVPYLPQTISSVYQLYHVLLDSKQNRDGLKEHLDSKGISSKVYFNPVHLEPYYKRNYPEPNLPVTEDIAGRILTLPFYPHMTETEITAICDAIDGFFA